MKRFATYSDKLLKLFAVICVVAMSLLVFSNVVSRYIFDSSIPWANEMSRFFFVWLVFFGAIEALKSNEHMAVDLLVGKLPKVVRKISFVFINLVILFLLYMIFDGSIKITQLSINSPAPATGIPFSFMNGMGIILSVGMAIIVITRLITVLFFKDDVDKYMLPKSEVEELVNAEEGNKL
ncbi:TRAP transporter small permease [Sporosarcina pasteurii]|uniref:2,3-diketo-L-gulonate TRAP transporter small permease protein yiaM n=1 Tax=Sporosarcina pasteurii TaxID=1474 RepID=A0A380BDL5_SPOPA|nr:TRAP transporter small permease [Sporosarcina pasteurii]MDS9472472.1 TRAP transporter small permease [Sporosarcina pasteurii]QBQ06028.1 TRAP transporter small permease [Sporosarcina pasteurii]SUI99651.1 2,3-diketo-L-gulonate TRAP transporter small permease protein yiaM [Sporosarcina pasteurii]